MGDRQLVLLRHAKAQRPTGVRDVERSLTARGRRDAAAAGGWLVSRGLVPDLAICSTAVRARETLQRLASVLPAPPVARYDALVYQASAAELLALVRAVETESGTVLLVGHNPSMEELAAMLDPAGGPADGLRTAGMTVHEVDREWSALRPGGARLVDAVTARG